MIYIKPVKAPITALSAPSSEAIKPPNDMAAIPTIIRKAHPMMPKIVKNLTHFENWI